ncbi:MAG: DNA polymerase III subunit delta [Saprospiraceae bacterium]|nr:DNA polymerase III subunit delta [Saprospiraceae bacterium]MDW8483580.1 DNA polymerase III subunit delta [Saprospiraceae bacterium]
MRFDEVLRDIKTGKFSPLYLLHGEEPYFIDRIEAAIEMEALPEEERVFNQTILYGKDAEPTALLDQLCRYPIMSARQVVVLREAQEMKGLTELASYAENPMPSTIFVICYKHKKFDLRTQLGKAIISKGIVFESKKLYESQLPDWITAYCKEQRRDIEPAAAALLAEYLGADLAKIVNELDKLMLNLPAGSSITTAHVETFVGVSKEYNVFELQRAFALRDRARIARIEYYFAANMRKNPLPNTIASLYNYFSKVYMLYFLSPTSDAELAKTLDLRSDFFIKEYKTAARNYTQQQVEHILHLLHMYDLRVKGINTDTTHTSEEALMRELFFRILNEV